MPRWRGVIVSRCSGGICGSSRSFARCIAVRRASRPIKFGFASRAAAALHSDLPLGVAEPLGFQLTRCSATEHDSNCHRLERARSNRGWLPNIDIAISSLAVRVQPPGRNQDDGLRRRDHRRVSRHACRAREVTEPKWFTLRRGACGTQRPAPPIWRRARIARRRSADARRWRGLATSGTMKGPNCLRSPRHMLSGLSRTTRSSTATNASPSSAWSPFFA